MGRTKLKHDEKKGIIDEYEIADIDKNEAKLGRERRARRWKEIEMEQQYLREMEKAAIKDAEKMKANPINRPPTPLEEAWLRCDYILWNLMTPQAYSYMEYQRKHEPKAYKYLYKVFMPKHVMKWATQYVDLLANDHYFIKRVPLQDVVKYYRKYKGIKTTIKVKHKGEEEKEL